MMTKLTLRSLAAHRLRLILTVAAVTIGVSFVAGTMIFRDTATRSFDALFAERTQGPEVVVRPRQVFTSEEAPRRSIPLALRTTLEQVPGAESVYGQIQGFAAILGRDGEVVGAGSVAHLGRDYVDRPGSTQKILYGRVPVTADEVVVETRTATEGQIKVGDQVTIVTQRPPRTMRVVGIFTFGEELTDIVTYVGFAPDVAQNLLTEAGQYSAIWVRPRPGISQEQLVAQINAVLPPDYEVTTGQQESEEAKAEIEALFALLGRFLLAFAGISVFVGSFVIFNTFTMLVAQRTRELALLRAVGASRRQVTRAVLGEAIGIGLLGSTLGLVVGVGVSFVLRLIFERLGTHLPVRTPVIELRTVLISYVVGTAVTVVAAYFPARRASRIPPVAALRDDVTLPRRSRVLRLVGGSFLVLIGALALSGGLSEGGEDGAGLIGMAGIVLVLALAMLSPFLGRPVVKVIGWPIARLAGATGRLSRENARRDPLRTAATASALMVGLALVSTATVLTNSMNASVDREFDRQFGADFAMEPRGLVGFSADAVTRVAAVPGVRSVAPVQFGTMRVADQEVSIIVADASALTIPVNLKVESGSSTPDANELLVERSLADERGWQVGSSVPGQYPDQTTATLRVAGVFADNRVVNRQYIMNPSSYRAHAPGTLIQKAYVDLDDENLGQARDSVRSVLRAYPYIQLKDRQDAKADARQDVDQLLNVVVVLLVLSIVIAALGIMNTLGLSVIERTREIGLLRAVGMGRGQVRAMIRYESVVIALFGASLGVTLGVAIGWALQRALAADGVEVLSVPLHRLGLYLVSAVAIGVVAAILPARRAARMSVLQAVHHE
jgi:putative ABC transport system permease protein